MKEKIVCGLIAFWPFILAVFAAELWAIYSWTVPLYDANFEAVAWIAIGRGIGIISVCVLAVVIPVTSWIWCEGNYRECIGLPRYRNQEEKDK
jgi:hypothetical protein